MNPPTSVEVNQHAIAPALSPRNCAESIVSVFAKVLDHYGVDSKFVRSTDHLCGIIEKVVTDSHLDTLKVLRSFVEWDNKYPKGTVHPMTGEKELDALFEAARKQLEAHEIRPE
jgi:hypothetical protein